MLLGNYIIASYSWTVAIQLVHASLEEMPVNYTDTCRELTEQSTRSPLAVALL